MIIQSPLRNIAEHSRIKLSNAVYVAGIRNAPESKQALINYIGTLPRPVIEKISRNLAA